MSRPEGESVPRQWNPSFGVEFEFLVAAICNPKQPKVHPEDPRQVYFDTVDQDFRIQPPEDAGRTVANRFTIQRHIRAALREQNFATGDGDNKDITVWEVVQDPTINGPWGKKYQYFGVEVRTPAFSYSDDALHEIRNFCRFLQSRFRVSVNESCGLHVHVGNRGNGFALPHLRRVVAFLYAFEPQLNTVHPDHRLHNVYCDSFREGTNYAWSFRTRAMPLPSLADALNYWLSRPQLPQLTQMASSNGGSKLAYRIERIRAAGNNRARRALATIEFRQHQGTLDSEAVVMWVQTVVGIMTWLNNASRSEVQDLFTIATQENWAAEGELGGCHDADKLNRFGPAFADEGFTVIDLLKRLNLIDQANYYKDKLHCHVWLEPRLPSASKNDDKDDTDESDNSDNSDNRDDQDDSFNDGASTWNIGREDTPEEGSPSRRSEVKGDVTGEVGWRDHSFEREFPAMMDSAEDEQPSATNVSNHMPISFPTFFDLPLRPINKAAGTPEAPAEPPANKPSRASSWSENEEAIMSGSSDGSDQRCITTPFPRAISYLPPSSRRNSSLAASEELNALPADAHAWTSPTDPYPLPRDLVINPQFPKHRLRFLNVQRNPDYEVDFWTKKRTLIPYPIITQARAYPAMDPQREVYPGPERRRPRANSAWSTRIYAYAQALLNDALDESPPEDAETGPQLSREERLEQMLAGHGPEWDGLDEEVRRGIRIGAGVQLEWWRFGAKVENDGERSLEERVQEWQDKEDQAWRAEVLRAENHDRESQANKNGTEWEPLDRVEGVADPFRASSTQGLVSPEVSPTTMGFI